MEIFVNVTNQKMSISSSFCNVVSGSQEFVKFKFILGEEWDGLLTFAQFTQNGNAYNSYLDENNCAYLPSEINGGTCTLMLYGADGTVKATTNYLTLKVESSALISDASSTNISKSLYDQLVERFNRIANLDQSQYGAEIARQVSEIMAGYLANGDIAAATIQDGSIPRTKVNSAFEATLAKADNSWQKSANAPSGTWEATYDPQGIQDDIFNYVSVANNTTKTYIDGQISNVTNRSGTGTLDTARQEIADARIFQSDYTPQYNPTVIGGQFNYNTLKDSLHGVYQQSKAYADAKFRDYSPFDIQFLEQPPTASSEAGEERTFYLVPKTDSNGNITGYDKWWYIQNADGYWVWDTFGSTSTVVTTAANLPTVGDPDTDYIVAVDGGYIYKKYIGNQWVVIAGSMAKVLTSAQFEALQSGDELTDYYVPNSDGVYLHYRWINNDFELVGSDSYSKAEVDTIVQGVSTTIGNRISSVESNVQTNVTNIESLSRTVNRVANDLGNLDVEGYTYSSTLTQNDNGQYIYTLVESKDNVDTIKSQFVLPSGGGSGSATTTTMVVDRITPSPLIITATGSAIIEIDFSSLDSDGQTVDGNYTWKLDNSVLMTGTLNQGRNSFDLSSYCAVGSQRFTLIVTDIGGSTNVKTWTVQKVEVGIGTSFDDSTTNEIGKSVSFSYVPHGGSISKVIHFKLDGVENTVTTTASGTPQSYTIPAQTHGSHLLEVWATANINNVPVETSHIYKDIIWYDPNKDGNNNYLNPVIGCTYRFDYYGNLTARQYDTTSIVYNVFDPSNDYPTVKRYVDNVLVGEDTISSSQNTWNFMSPDVGLHTLRIECGNTSVIIKIQVNELGIDVSPVTANLEIDFNPTGINNNSSNRIWSNDNYAMTVSENFDWVNGGYKIDENGDSYFLIKAGTRATFNYNMFAGNVLNNIKQTGAEMKICFMTENVQNINAVWLSNVETTTIDVDGEIQTTNVGLQLGAHEGWLKTNTAKSQNTTDANGKIIVATNTYLYTPYSEEDIIEMDVNIGSVGSNNKGYIMAYEDGVPSKAFVYGSLDRLYQYTPQPLIIGSDYCDVRIYRMKLYSSSLSSEDIMRNFIADSRDATTMLQRYDRNSIYYHREHGYSPYSSNGTLDPVKLAPLIPNVKVLMLDTEHFTLNKKNFVKSSLRCIHAPGGDLYPGDPYYDNWLFENGFHSGQGTTSDNYGASARNVDFIFNCDGVHFPYYDKNKRNPSTDIDPNYISRVTLGYGLGKGVEYTDTVTDWEGDSGKIALTRTSVPNNFFNFKVNVASSENVNNALFQKRYNDFLPYISPAKQRDSKIKNDMEFVPAILFIRENSEDLSQHTEFDDREWHFYALGNLGDSKKTDYTRAYDPEDMNEFTIEISDNTPNNAQFQTGVYYMYHEVNSPTISNVGNYFELIEGRYTPANSNTFSDSTTYYTRTRHLETYTMDSNGNPVSDANPQVCAYPITLSEWNNNNMRYWCLYNEDFDGDHSFEPRYACCGDYRDGKLVNNTKGTSPEEEAQINKNNDVWRAFYRWVVTSTDEEFVNELDEWCVRSAVEYFYAFTHMYTMIDNRAKNTFWHFAKTGTYRAVSKPVPELLHVYCELVNDEYVVTADTVVNPNKTYYTQYAFDLWMYDGDTAVGINNNGELKFPYGKEDIDFNVDGDNQSGYLYNGALSVFWCRLRDLLPTEISNIFQDSSSPNKFKAGHLIKQFEDFQNCFPEEIWRLDIERKYIRTFSGQSIDGSKPVTDEKYLKEMMQGRKKYQRRQWIRDQEIYFGTKHLSNVMLSDGNQNVNQIVYRCYNPGSNANPQPNYDIVITPFSDMYVSARFGNSGGVSQKRAKAGVPCTIEISSNNATDTQVIIYAANRVQALNDLSANYLATLNIANATRLRKLIIGSSTSGYQNTSLSSLELTNNKLLEELDIRNCIALSGGLDLTNCKNLVKLYAEGTTLQSVAFANNGRVEIAHLPNTINALEMRNLNNLSDFQATLNFLTSLILEGGTINSKQFISDHINTLLSLQLYNIDWTGLNNSLGDTTLLNQIYSLGDGNAILTGNVYISDHVRSSEINQFQERWKNLEVTYNSANLVTQYLATYVNPGGTVLYQTYVDQGATPPDPVTLGYISTPTQTATAQYTFTYNGWDDITSAMLSARTITAQYTQTVRTYTVTWYAREGLSLGSTTANYGAEVVYNGDLPTDTSGETQYIYKVFTGWNKSTGYITEDTDVYAVWETASTLPPTSKDLSQMTCAEIYGVCQAGMASTYFSDKDHFDITLGSDFTFENVQSEVLLENCFFDGNGHRYENGVEKTNSYIDTNIKLFDTDSPSFTLAVDYEFLGTTVNNGCLVSNCDGNNEDGFRLQFNTDPRVKWGNKTVTVGTSVNRNIVVLRHVKDSNTMFVYTYNTGDTTYDLAITRTEAPRSNKTKTSQVLTFGCVRNLDGTERGRYGKGWIYWAKIWYDDLGDNVARKLSSWIREPLRMEYIGANRYLLPNSMSNYANASFLANNSLPLLRRMNPKVNNSDSNAGGWAESEMRTFLNTRLYEALPYKWQAVIKQVSVQSSAGATSYSITSSNDKLYLAANREVGGGTDSPYVDEVDVTSTISFFTNNRKRLKFCGVIVDDNAQFIVDSSEPTLLTSYTVNEGDIWINSNNQDTGYIYMSASTIAKHTRIGYRAVSSSDNIQASNGGCWVRAHRWWGRSPGASNSTYFMYVTYDGNPNNGNNASSANGVALGFSI